MSNKSSKFNKLNSSAWDNYALSSLSNKFDSKSNSRDNNSRDNSDSRNSSSSSVSITNRWLILVS